MRCGRSQLFKKKNSVNCTKAERLRFLELAVYCCCFCANFSAIVAPLNNLLKAVVKYIWSPD